MRRKVICPRGHEWFFLDTSPRPQQCPICALVRHPRGFGQRVPMVALVIGGIAIALVAGVLAVGMVTGWTFRRAAPAEKLKQVTLPALPTGVHQLNQAQSAWAVDLSPDGQLAAIAIEGDVTAGDIVLWDVKQSQEVRRLAGLKHITPRAVAFGLGGQRVLAANSDGDVCCWKVSGGPPVWRWTGDRNGVTLAVSPRGQFVAVASIAGRSGIQLLHAETGAEVRHIDCDGAHKVAFSADGNLLVTGTWGGPILLFHVPGGQAAGRLEGHTSNAKGLTVSSDGLRLLSTSLGTLRLWDLRAQKELTRLNEKGLGFDCAVFLPSGLATLNHGKLARWDQQPEGNLTPSPRPGPVEMEGLHLTDLRLTSDAHSLILVGSTVRELTQMAIVVRVPLGE